MSSLALVQTLHENLSRQAGVKMVFGEPIAAGDKTIIPVAKIMYGFGAGGGAGGMGETQKGEGGGGGGGVRAKPVGVFVVDSQESRFVAVHDRRRTAAVLLAGVALGIVVARRSLTAGRLPIWLRVLTLPFRA